MRYYRVENTMNEQDHLMDEHLMEPSAWGLAIETEAERVVRLGETVVEYV